MPWKRFKFRGKQKVYAHVDEDGAPVVDDGRVRMRYNLDSAREYSASERNLSPIDDAPIKDVEVPPAVDPDEARKKSKGKSGGRRSKSKSRVKPDEVVQGTHGAKLVEKPTEIPTRPEDGVVLAFTDGACTGNPGPAGLGVLLTFGDHYKEIWEYLGTGTNNIAELTAILRALEAVQDTTQPMHLYTDSSYSIGVLARGWKAKANRELIERIRDKMKTFDDLTLFKVEGHAGYALNEHVDGLAVNAISERGSGERRGKGSPDGIRQTPQKTKYASSSTGSAAARGVTGVKVIDTPSRIPEEPSDGVILAFTDGACFGNPGPAAAAAVIAGMNDGDDETLEISEYLGEATNNIAELTAILRVLEAVDDRSKPLHIYTDSSYSIGVLGRGWKAKANRELIVKIRELLAEFDDVTLHKVKGHAGHTLNERVDALAKRAIETRQG